ncbi:LysE family transporter [Roseivirga sp.]|uniref:LysE family transporter n=1 Tax=Roseivirga sp. TaxID=1964215 RepID=UPI003B52EBA2
MLWAVFSSLLLATAISFAGSVQLGPVNFGTIHTALNKDKKSALRFGFGGSLPELLYCGLAFASANLLDRFDGFQDTLKYLTIGVLLIFGTFLMFQKSSSGAAKHQMKKGNELWLGATFGLLNPQLYPFWLFVITNLKTNQILNSTHWLVETAFVLGSALGAFLLQYLVAEFTSRKREFIYMRLTKNYNKVLGTIIIGIALIQLLLNL